MKEEAMIMTIHFGNNHFNAIYLKNQLRLITSSGRMINVEDMTSVRTCEEGKDLSRNLINFFKH